MNKKIHWWDWFVYRLFYWRWGKILARRPEMRELLISWLKAYDVVDVQEKIVIEVSIKPKQ